LESETAFERIDLSFLKKITAPDLPFSAMAVALTAQDILSEKSQCTPKGQKRLDFLFHEFAASFSKFSDPLEGISALNSYLFTQKQFKSFKEEIKDPSTVFITKVIENREGIPLSLALIYRELARRIHGPVEIINFPGNFFIKILYQHQLLFLDPSESGKLLSVSELQKWLSARLGQGISLNGSFLETAPEKQVATRFLNHLKGIYFESRCWPELLAILDMIIAIQPDRVGEYKERGLLLYQLGQHSLALGDIQKFVDRSRPSVELDKLKGLLTHLQSPEVTPLF